MGVSQLDFALTNTHESSIKLIWDDVAYVDIHGDVGRTMHKGIKYIDREKQQQDSNIPSGGKLDDMVLPIANVYWSDGYNGFGTGWKEAPLLKNRANKKDFEALKRSTVGEIIKVVFPFVIGGDKYEYTFLFTVKDANLL